MDVEIVKKDGSMYRLSDYGVVYDFVVGSITMEHYTDNVEGRHGRVDSGADYISRTISVPMKFKFREMHEYAHNRDELYGILTDSNSYYIRELRRPKRLEYEFVDFGQTPKWKPQVEDEYVDGKQYLVRMVNSLEPDQIYNGGEIEIEFETTELPFAETIYTTTELTKTGYVSGADMYGLVDGIDQANANYSFVDNILNVWNGGNVRIEPESMRLVLELRNVATKGNLIIRNNTTGEAFVYKDALKADSLKIDGVQVKTGSVNRLRNTNREFISLMPGMNEIEILGGTFGAVDVDTKFYYK